MLAKMRREQGLSKTPFFLNPQLKSPPLEGFWRQDRSQKTVHRSLSQTRSLRTGRDLKQSVL